MQRTTKYCVGNMYTISKHNGFTLVEVLVAMVIFTTGLVGMAGLSIVIIRGNTFSQQLTVATIFAQAKIEEAQSLGYANADTTAATEVWESANRVWVPANFSAPYLSYKRQTAIASNTPMGMKTVTVTVYWGADGHKVELYTILAP